MARPLRIECPGARAVDIVVPDCALTHGRGTVRTQRGPVGVDWTRTDKDGLTLSVSIPVNVRARVVPPAAAPQAVSASGDGQPRLVSDGGERAVYEIGSGRSQFTLHR
jgi:alpha-L-rhamnosidase